MVDNIALRVLVVVVAGDTAAAAAAADDGVHPGVADGDVVARVGEAGAVVVGDSLEPVVGEVLEAKPKEDANTEDGRNDSGHNSTRNTHRARLLPVVYH